MHDVSKKIDLWSASFANCMYYKKKKKRVKHSKRPAHKQRSLIGYRLWVCRGVNIKSASPHFTVTRRHWRL
jgi:hypothetical protein